MREFSAPAMATVERDSNITDFLMRNVREVPQGLAYRRKNSAGVWFNVTWSEFHEEVRALAKGFVHAGITPGDRVGLMSRTRYEWTLADLALWYCGAIVVPIYETSSPDQVAYIVRDSGAKAVIVEDALCQAKVAEAGRTGAPVEHVWRIDNGELDALSVQGKDISAETLEAARSYANLNDIATIIYTSGTTGEPKGCELTHGNFAILAANACAKLRTVLVTPDGDPGSTLLFITLAHVFARFVEVLCLAAQATMGHTSDITEVSADLQTFKPSFVLSVPRVFEKVFNAAEQKAKTAGKGKVFDKAVHTALAYSHALDTGRVGLSLALRHKVFDVLVYRKLRAAMGGQLMYAVSGGAPLGERLGHFFRGAGITILEGYGLTESTAPTTVNIPALQRIGTVGPPLPGTSVRIADDGEIMLAGPHIFSAYRNKPDQTAECKRDGWFYTGDLGELTDEGCLRITGRKKEILITAGGKNVAPAGLEDRMRAHPLISQAIVVGDARPFIAALITLDAEMLPTWLAAEGLPDMTVAQAIDHQQVLTAIQGAVDDANQTVSRAESIRTFRILTTDFTVDSGHLTPSLKLRRMVIMNEFAAEVEAIYRKG